MTQPPADKDNEIKPDVVLSDLVDEGIAVFLAASSKRLADESKSNNALLRNLMKQP